MEIIIRCSRCGEELNNGIVNTIGDTVYIEVDMCEDCLKEEKEESYELGKEEND